MKRILCFGDSNTWGFTPGTGERYPDDVRWTGVCQKALGAGYKILEDGLNGRTTALEDFSNPWLNGSKNIGYSLIAQKPLDMIVLSLGTNDLKFTGATGSGKGMDALLKQIMGFDVYYKGSTPVFPNGIKVLLVSPIQIHENSAGQTPEYGRLLSHEESVKFPAVYAGIAKAYGIEVLDASQFAQPSTVDNVHMGPESHHALGLAIAEKIKEIFNKEEA
jgi:lysophospholipase L1-like esterase